MAEKTTTRWLEPRGRLVLGALCVAGIVIFAVGLGSSPGRVWRNLLVSNFLILGGSVVGILFIALQYVARAGWATVIRRVPEAMSGYIPVGAALMALLMLGVHSVYPWAHGAGAGGAAAGHDAVIEAKAAYLNVPAFILRTGAYLFLWWAFARVLVRRSRKQDESGDVEMTHRNVRTSVLFIILLAVSFSLASVDWVMSLEPHWFSTLFPWYVASSIFVSGMAGITALVILLRRRGLLPGVGPHHLHDLGKYVFAFSGFWAYLWFSQYMLIWYTNIPEETAYYALRSHGWSPLFFLNIGVNLAVPFLVLLPAATKRNPAILFGVCLVVIAGHWLDMYLMVMPSLMHSGPAFGVYEVGIALATLSAFLLVFDVALRRAPTVPERDPYLAESLHHVG